jgi:lipopolysaccharide transport system ATP-binding protein
VRRGEVIGVIGRNGAGKSTLLKILSRITKPTEGHAEIHGRVGSLLEVGTGFHPELTGRDNIYLNGAILGMKRKEIDSKFDEIVEFSEIGKFLDTPVKRYSSGMYVRLAFAVAAHLDPEILLVDEVLAVGDAGFQKKCLGKMQSVSGEGRTVLFVSHNMSAVVDLCPQAVLIERGRLQQSGNSLDVVQGYLKMLRDSVPSSNALAAVSRPEGYQLQGKARLLSCELVDHSLVSGWSVEFGQTLVFDVMFEVYVELASLELGTAISAAGGLEICSVATSDRESWREVLPGTYRAHLRFPELHLLPGSYKLGFGLRSDEAFEDYLPEVAYFDVTLSNSSTDIRTRYRKGVLVPKIQVSLSSLDLDHLPT